ncbi:MAG: gephyrin-like molybdotransferase Glp [Ardenticatenales bacterium]
MSTRTMPTLSAPHPPTAEIPVDDALALILASVDVLAPTERIPFTSAAGRVLAAPVAAPEAMPPFAASSRDGYAVVAADGVGARRVVGEAVAGGAGGVVVTAGTAARITTGAPLPQGADAVVMVEDIARGFAALGEDAAPTDGADWISVQRGVEAGENVRPAGQDYAAGDVVLHAGDVVGAAELGLLASVGAVEVEVVRRPKVIVFSTGDELVEPESALGPGQIRDSNRFALAEAVRQAGADVLFAGHIGDEQGDLEALGAAVASADVLVTSGGVSMGHRDLVKPWLAEHGRLVFGRVRTKPGKPVTFAIVEGTPCFALPGFPVSALVCFELFVRPALRRMAGHREVRRPSWPVRLAHDVVHAGDRVEFARAVVTVGDDGRATAATTGFQGSGRLLSLAHANALLRLEGESGVTRAGAMVTAILTGPVGGDTAVSAASSRMNVADGARTGGRR